VKFLSNRSERSQGRPSAPRGEDRRKAPRSS
jgi:hypothetical protein